MEGLKVRAFVLTGILLATGALCAFSPRPGSVPGLDEHWMETHTPRTGKFQFLKPATPPDGDDLCTYKDPKEIYDDLKPTVGILARVYDYDGHQYDVNLIASRDKASFHDPHVCFTAQRYTIVDGPLVSIPTKTRGEIQATLADLTSPDGKPALAVYFYRGPKGFYGTTMGLKWALLFDQFKGRVDLDGVFYRFIFDGPDDPDNQQRLIGFIGDYMDEAGKDSGGYF